MPRMPRANGSNRDPETDTLVTPENLVVPAHLRHRYAHLIEHGLIEPIRGVGEGQLDALPRDVLRRIETGDPTWEAMLPAAAARLIKERKLFCCQEAPASAEGSHAGGRADSRGGAAQRAQTGSPGGAHNRMRTSRP